MRHREKDNLWRVNRALRLTKECGKALVRAEREHELLNEICRIILDVGGYRLTWVGYAENDSAKHVTPVAQAGYEEGYLRNLDISWDDNELGRGPTGTAIRTGRAVTADDILTNPLFEPWRADATSRGYRSSIAVPLVAGGKPFGALNIYAVEPNAFEEEESDLLSQLAADLAYGITALRTRAEQGRTGDLLRQNQEIFHLITENVSDLIALVDSDGKRIYNSASYRHILGDPGSLKGTDSMMEIHPDDRERISNVFRETMRTGIGQRSEYRFLAKDGSVRYIESQGNVIHDGSASRPRLLVVSRDVTERKLAEEQRALLQEQLRQAQKLESVGTLAGGIAHDFNNILSIVLGAVSLLELKRTKPSEHAKLVRMINDTVQRGAALARQLLTFARKTEAALEPLSVNDTINDLVRMLKATFPEAITFSLNLNSGLPYIVADKSQIHQALLNLCVNARDAMPQGGTLTIGSNTVEGEALHRRFGNAAGDRYLCLRVSDTGIGMDEATKARMFEPFFTTKAPGIGTGLGLAVVYGVVKSHRGFIDFESRVSGGTSFNLYFPVSAQAPRSEGEAVAAGGDIPRGNGEVVLVVEDETAIRDVVRAVLEDTGYSVLTANDGTEAVELYRTQWKEIDVVISDIGLPRQNGVDAFLRMKEINPAAKVIFATGYLDPNLRGQIMDHGAQGFLQKPYVSGEILRMLHGVIHGDSERGNT